jgi:hypothetical protein
MKDFNFAGVLTWLASELIPKKYAASPATEAAASDVPPSDFLKGGSWPASPVAQFISTYPGA